MRYIAALIPALLVLSSGLAQAAPITYQFRGVIDSVYEPENEFGGAVHVGDAFVVSYSFDSESVDLSPYAQEGRYEGHAASLVLPDLTLTSASELDVTSYGYLTFGTPYNGQTRFVASFYDPRIASDDLPLAWHGIEGQLSVFSTGFGKFFGTIAPEPASAGMLLLGLCLVRTRRSGPLIRM